MNYFIPETVQRSTGHCIKVTYGYKYVTFTWRGWFGDNEPSMVSRRIARNDHSTDQLRVQGVRAYMDWLDAGPSYAEEWPAYERTVTRITAGDLDRKSDAMLVEIDNGPQIKKVVTA